MMALPSNRENAMKAEKAVNDSFHVGDLRNTYPFIILFVRGTVARHEMDLWYRSQSKVLGALHQ